MQRWGWGVHSVVAASGTVKVVCASIWSAGCTTLSRRNQGVLPVRASEWSTACGPPCLPAARLKHTHAWLHPALHTPQTQDLLHKRRMNLDICRYLCLDEADRMVDQVGVGGRGC